MSADASIARQFVEQARAAFPDSAAYLTTVPEVLSSSDPYHEVLVWPWPVDPTRAVLNVCFRGDSFEAAFALSDVRGPAEQTLISDHRSGMSAVAGTIAWLGDFFAERIVVVIEEHRVWSLWGAPYRLAFFQPVADRLKHQRMCEVVSWRGTYNSSRAK